MKNRNYIYAIFLALTTISCNGWLDIQPENQASTDDLYSEGEGFRTQLNGVYIQLSEENLYGKELTWGFLDVIGQYYVADKVITPYKEANDFAYGNESVKAIIKQIWEKSFHAVADCNSILAHIQKADTSIFELGLAEKNLIEGEALALRAFIHLDMLRLFAPSPEADDRKTYIPYVTEDRSVLNKPQTVSYVLDKIIEDLTDAKRLVGSFDTLPGHLPYLSNLIPRLQEGSVQAGDKVPLFFMHRGYRMNYYAVTGVLARAYLYKGKKKEAYDLAKEIADTRYFNFTSQASASKGNGEGNRKLYDDVLWGGRDEKLPEWYSPYMNGTQGTLAIRNIESIFDQTANTSDFRFKYCTDALGTGRISIKNITGGSMGSESRISRKVIPFIRLSEMYYIMCEYLAETDLNEAKTLLSKLRSARGELRALPEIMSDLEMRDAILHDARREFIGEGQSFFLFKRLNLPIFDGVREISLQGRACLPIPESEAILL